MIVRFYQNMWDNDGEEHDLSIKHLIESLRVESKKSANRSDKEATLAMGVARYPDGVTRSKAGALDASVIALDIDEGWTLDAAYEACDALATPHVIYTTTKHTPAHHRFRIILFLNRPVVGWEEYEALWYGIAKRFNTTIDAKTRDISRISIVPRIWDGEPNIFHGCPTGTLLDVDAILKHYPPEPKPEASVAPSSGFFDPIQAHRMELRRQRNANVDPATLTDIHNSPIVPSKTLNEALSSSQGGRTYKLLCAVAASALRQGYSVGVPELAAISRQFSAMAGRKRISDFEHRNDSSNALKWAAANARVS